MANRTFKGVQALNRGVVLIAGRVTQGASNPSVTDGLGFSVAKNGNGDYTITLEDKYTGLLHAGVTYIGATDETFAQVAAHDVSSAKTVQFKFYGDDGAAQALAEDDEFTFMLALRNSTVP